MEPGALQSMGSLGVGQTERLHFHFSLSCIGEGNGNPLQCFCLENPLDGGAWWAARLWGRTESDTTDADLAAAAATLFYQGALHIETESESVSHSVVSDSLRPYEL